MNLKLFLELVAKSSGFKTELDGSGRAVDKFVGGARRELESLKRSVSSVTGKLAGLGLSVGAVQQLRASALLDKSLTQIGQTAGEGANQVKGLRTELFRMAADTGQGVENLRDGFNDLIQSGQTFGEARSTITGINVAMAVTGAKAQTLAKGLTVAGTAFQFDLAKPGKALELLDQMTVAGRLGNAELENLSDIFARVGVNAASAGMGFDKTLGFIEALSMVERQPERLATLADSTLRVFTNLRYMAEAQKGTGIKFFDAAGARRDPLAVLGDIKRKYDTLKTDKQRAIFIQAAFGKADLDTVKGIKTLLQGDSLNKIRNFTTQIANASGTLERDLPAAISNAVDQSGRLQAVLRKAADDFAQPINETLADLIKWSLDTKQNGGLDLNGKDMVVGGGALAIGTLLSARYGSNWIGSMAGKLLKSGSSVAVGVAEGKALQAAAGVTPVFITNWPIGGLPGILPDATPLPGGGSSKLASLGRYAVPIAVAVGYPVASEISDAQHRNGWGSQTYSRNSREYQVMGIGGVKNDITLNLRVDGQGRVFTDSSDPNTRARVALQRGDMMPSH